MLSGERSSGDIQNGFKGLRGLQLIWLGLYNPYPMRKYSSGISIACGCSSVTTDPHPSPLREHYISHQALRSYEQPQHGTESSGQQILEFCTAAPLSFLLNHVSWKEAQRAMKCFR
ncbi:hypothetical protein EE612_034836 [Oryza sativa]|nr:hypothetical protein EE612_034836 [Oryza sativa]